MNEEKDRTFPLKPGALWRAVWLGVLVGASSFAALDWLMGRPFSPRPTIALAIAAAITCAILYFVLGTRANSQRLLLANSWGARSALSWQDIASVVYMKRGGQPQWRITSTAGKHFWLARDTKNLRGLYELALKHGGTNNPLVKALERPVYEHE
jgi:hypothetical protein